MGCLVIVGIGWNRMVRLTDAAKPLGDPIELQVVTIPDALALYNKLKAEGRGGMFLVHSTREYINADGK
ncbi:hypothetical protein SH449x_004442 [Pirellulaceae bacterium SH449]